jgi:hypothetical protein
VSKTGDEGHDQDRTPPHGRPHSINPGVPCPETVLVAIMTTGSYLLVGSTNVAVTRTGSRAATTDAVARPPSWAT